MAVGPSAELLLITSSVRKCRGRRVSGATPHLDKSSVESAIILASPIAVGKRRVRVPRAASAPWSRGFLKSPTSMIRLIATFVLLIPLSLNGLRIVCEEPESAEAAAAAAAAAHCDTICPAHEPARAVE